MSNSRNISFDYITKFFRQSSHYATGQVAAMLAGFISFPILTRIFSTEEYGIFNLVMITLWTTVAFTKAGLQESAVRFYNEFDENSAWGPKSTYYDTLFYSSLLLGLLGALAVWTILVVFKGNALEREMQELTGLVVLMVISNSLFSRMTNFLRAEQRTHLYNVIMIGDRYLGLALSLLLVFFVSRTLKMYLGGLLAAEATMAGILFIIYLAEKKIRLLNFSVPFLKTGLSFGVPFVGFELANYLIKSADRYFIQSFMGASAVGIYSAGSNLCLYVKDLLITPVFYAITPLYMEVWKKGGKEETIKFISNVLKYLLYIVIPVIFGFSSLASRAIVLLASEKYEPAARIIPFILPGAVLYGLFPLFAAGLYIEKKTGWLTGIVGIGVILNATLNMVLIPHFQLLGSAMATLLTYVALITAMAVFSFRYLPIRFDFRAAGKVLLASACMFWILEHLHFGKHVIGLMAAIVAGFFSYLGIILMIDRKIRSFLFDLFAKAFGRSRASHDILQNQKVSELSGL